MNDEILRIQNVTKIYPGVKALDNVSFSIKKGEVRALVGENGAGKSTLIKCAMGAETPTSGCIEINVDGEWFSAHNTIEAKSLGMFANYQHVNIAHELSVAENYFLGRLPLKYGLVDWKTIYKESQKIIDRFELKIDPRDKISELPVALQAMVTISKISVNDKIRLVIFDEPTALLENDKVEILFRYIKELKSQGVSVIYISHRLEEIEEICDTVTILKDGKYVDTKNISDVDKDMLISMMVGRDIDDIYGINHSIAGEELLRIENLTHESRFSDVTFNLHRGEILGFFGLVGAGRSDVMKAIFGANEIVSGDIYVKGEKTKIHCPRNATRSGIGLLPENRREEGLALGLSVKENINMDTYDMISKLGVINLKKETNRAKEYVSKIAIKTSNLAQKVNNLSGGNQQKVVISKLLCRNPDVLIFDEATVGIDVGAKEEIYKLIEQLAASGKGIILISSYLPEVMSLSDRMIVMHEGAIVRTYDREALLNVGEKEILKIASGM